MNFRFTIYDLRARGCVCDRLPFVIRHSSCAAIWLLSAGSLPALPSRQSRGDIPPLAPPLPEFPPTFWEQHAGLVVTGLVLLPGLISVALWLVLRPKPRVVIPPEVQAREQLHALARLSEDGAVLSQVSQVLRRYLIAAFGMTGGEPTTTEFCVAVAAAESIGAELAARIGGFLRDCDERKFAPAATAPPLNAAARALELVELAEARRAKLRELPQPTKPA